MKYMPKPNTGALFENRKAAPNHPDVRGDIYLDKELLSKLMNKGDGLIKISLSGWVKHTSNGSEMTSLVASEPWEKKEEEAPF